MEAFTKYTKSWERPAEMEERANFTIPWTGEHEPPSHSLPSAVAGKVAETFGSEVFGIFHKKLLKAYFTENRTISDPAVLAEVAVESGIERDVWTEMMAPDPHPLAKAVGKDHAEAFNNGITAVPSVVVDNKYVISGAVDVNHYRRVINHCQAEQAEQ